LPKHIALAEWILTKEVICMDPKFVEQLFFNQIKTLTAKTIEKSYEYQFSDGWLRG